MKDLALGDLIKEDKEKAKLKRKAKIGRRIINKRVNSNFRKNPNSKTSTTKGDQSTADLTKSTMEMPKSKEDSHSREDP